MAEFVDRSSTTEPTPSWNTEFSSLESLETDRSSGGGGENLEESFVLSEVDSDWEEEDIRLLRLLKDPNFDIGVLLGKVKSHYPKDGLYLAKVRQILKDVTDWKKIHDLLMEDFRNDSTKEKLKKYRDDLIKLRGKLSSLKRVHKTASKKLTKTEESYQQVCEERDALQQRLLEYEEKFEQMSEQLEKTQHSIQTQDQEKQNLKNQVISLEGEKSKLEHCKIEAEKLRTENRSLTERNVGLQGECQHLVNQLYQMSEEDRERLSILDQVISANKLQISVLRSERDDLERKNLEHVLTSSSVHTNSASLLFSPDGVQMDRRRRHSLIKDNWTQHTD